MVELTLDQLYYNARNYWFQEHGYPIGDLTDPYNNTSRFHLWLESQGARIHTPDLELVVDRGGFAPGYSTLQFDSQDMATLFILRWS